nr:dynamin-related protein 3A [Ipomoea batatas]
MSSSGDEQASSGGVDLRLLVAIYSSGGGVTLAPVANLISGSGRQASIFPIKGTQGCSHTSWCIKARKEVGLTNLKVLQISSSKVTDYGVTFKLQGTQFTGLCHAEYSYDDVDPCEDLTDEDIRTAIQNATQRSCLITTFHPYRRPL